MEQKTKYWLNQQEVQTFSLALLATVATSFALSYTNGIMIPFVLSIFLYFILEPLRSFFIKKLKLPNMVSLLGTFAVVILLLSIVFYVLILAVQEFVNGYEEYQAKAIYFAEITQSWLLAKGLPIGDVSFSDIVSRIPFTQIARGAGVGAFSLFSKTLLVFIFLLFIFTGTSRNLKKDQQDKDSLFEQINGQIRKYITIKLLTSLSTGILTYFIFTILRLDLAFVFGFLAFVLNFIPTLGSVVAVILPLPIAFFQYDSPVSILLVLLLPSLVQVTIGNVIEPRAMGERLDIHPVTVLLSLMFWYLIWGVAGAFLAVPITAVLKIVLTKIEGGMYVSKLMSGNFD